MFFCLGCYSVLHQLENAIKAKNAISLGLKLAQIKVVNSLVSVNVTRKVCLGFYFCLPRFLPGRKSLLLHWLYF